MWVGLATVARAHPKVRCEFPETSRLAAPQPEKQLEEQLQALQQTPLAALQPKTQLEKHLQALQRTPLAALPTETQLERTLAGKSLTL